MRLFFPLTGDDIFISYSRRDGALYAAGLADKLTKNGMSCFIDKLGTEPDHDLPPSLTKKIRNCTVFVLIGTEKAAQSDFVGKEIAEFKHTKRTILPIDFGGSVGRANWYNQIPGLAVETEKDPKALETGDPSKNVIAFIEKSFKYTRRNQHMFRMVLGALSLFVALVGLGIGSYVVAMGQVDSAEKLADAQLQRAEAATLKADAETVKANAAEQRAIEKEKIADQKELEAQAATQKADEAEKLAAEKNREATEAARRAEEQTRRAELAEVRRVAAENEAKNQEKIATARRLAVESKIAAEKTDYSEFIGSYDPQRSVLLAVQSLKTLQTPHGMQALRDAITTLGNRTYGVELNEEGNVSISPDGRFLGVVDGQKAYLRTINGSRFVDRPIPDENITKLIFSENSLRFASISTGSALVRNTETFDHVTTFAVGEDREEVHLNFDGTQLLEENAASGPCGQNEAGCAVSQNRTWMVRLDDQGTLQIVDLQNGRSSSLSKKVEGESSVLAVSNDGKSLAVSEENTVTIWRVDGWKELGRISLEWMNPKMAFSSDNDWLTIVTPRVSFDAADLQATVPVGSTIRVWSMKDARVVDNFSLAREGGLDRPHFTSDGKMLLTMTPVLSNDPNAAGKKRARLWILSPDDLMNFGCSLLSRNLSKSEWNSIVTDNAMPIENRETCKGLPVPDE